ncbi:hypothetical protein ACET3Z_009118 [Daucus carota]
MFAHVKVQTCPTPFLILLAVRFGEIPLGQLHLTGTQSTKFQNREEAMWRETVNLGGLWIAKLLIQQKTLNHSVKSEDCDPDEAIGKQHSSFNPWSSDAIQQALASDSLRSLKKTKSQLENELIKYKGKSAEGSADEELIQDFVKEEPNRKRKAVFFQMQHLQDLLKLLEAGGSGDEMGRDSASSNSMA